MKKLIVLAGLLSLPAAARAGACVYTPEVPEGDPTVACTYLEDEARCAAEAARHASPEWLQQHPQAFSAKLACNQAVAAALGKAGKPEKGARAPKGAAKPVK